MEIREVTEVKEQTHQQVQTQLPQTGAFDNIPQNLFVGSSAVLVIAIALKIINKKREVRNGIRKETL